MKSKEIRDTETTTCSEKQFEHLLRLVATLQSAHSGASATVAENVVEDDEYTAGRYQVNMASDQIARRAFQLYLQRGGTHGWDMADWLQAEEEMRQKQEREQNMRRLALAWGVVKSPAQGAGSLQ